MKFTSFFKFAAMTIIATTVMLGTTSCSDDDDDDKGEPTPSLFVPEKMVLDDEGSISTYTISYDNELRITGINEIGEDTDYSHKMEYDNEGRLSKVTYKWGSNTDTYTYSYSGNKATVAADEHGYISTYIYTMDANGLVTGYEYKGEYSNSNVSYKYDADQKLTQHLGTDYNLTYSYNNDVTGIGKDINVSNLMAISFAAQFDVNFFDFLLSKDKNFSKIAADDRYSSTLTYVYSEINAAGYPEKYELVLTEDGEDYTEYTVAITYKEINFLNK